MRIISYNDNKVMNMSLQNNEDFHPENSSGFHLYGNINKISEIESQKLCVSDCKS